MKTARSLVELGSPSVPLVLTIGSFDGVHRGHQQLIRRASEEAARLSGEAWVLTFTPHPLKVLAPERAPALLTSTEHKLAVLASLGPHGCLLLPFTPEFARQEPAAFFEQLHAAIPTLRTVVVGQNWRFGRGAKGTPQQFRELAANRGIEVIIQEPLMSAGAPISSTRVREAVMQGDLPAAADMLGRPFSVLGPVVHGDQLGKALGYPTANVYRANEVLPPPGIYATRVTVGDHAYHGATYLGAYPTTGATGKQSIVEVHLLDFEGDLYEQELEVFFVERLREDRRFASTVELKEQIRRDVARAREVLSRAGGQRLPAPP